MTKFSGHTLEGAILRKNTPWTEFDVKLITGGVLKEYSPDKPQDFWNGTWSIGGNGELILQIGKYRSVYNSGGKSLREYPGMEDESKVSVRFLQEGREKKNMRTIAILAGGVGSFIFFGWVGLGVYALGLLIVLAIIFAPPQCHGAAMKWEWCDMCKKNEWKCDGYVPSGRSWSGSMDTGGLGIGGGSGCGCCR